MSRLIILSNRVKLPNDKQAGGLAIAVANALQQRCGVWLGWNGSVIETDKTVDLMKQSLTLDDVTYIIVPLSKAQYQHFYCGFANNVLWAFLHDREDLIDEHPEDFAVYQQVNEQFARYLLELIEPDDVIWVHDYHFLSVAYYCRQLGMRNRIGFFLHIPFASPERWQHCPHADQLLAHLSDYDVIGLQTQLDKRHCQAVLSPLLAHKNLTIESFPIGVDVTTIQRKIQNFTHEKTSLIKIIAVDRIDYSKGIVRRLAAFAEFLRQYPHYKGRIQLQQIACPSRLDLPAYQEFYQQVKEQVISVQDEFATAAWQPLIYSESVLAHEQLMQVFFDSHIGWVNSLKDGMNLVAKEYIVAQNPSNPGVLLLSQYVGASEQMHEAIIIDPYDEQQVVNALLYAVTMSPEEKQSRYHALMKGLQQQDLLDWQNRFLNYLYANNQDRGSYATNPTTN